MKVIIYKENNLKGSTGFVAYIGKQEREGEIFKLTLNDTITKEEDFGISIWGESELTDSQYNRVQTAVTKEYLKRHLQILP